MFIKAAFCIVLFAICVGLCCYVTLEEWHEESKTLPYFAGCLVYLIGFALELIIETGLPQSH